MLMLNLGVMHTELRVQWIMRWLELRFDFDSTAVGRPFDCLLKVIKVTVT